MVSNKNVCRSAEDMTFTYYSQKPFQYVFVDWHYLSDQRINRWLYLSSSLQRNSLGNSPSPRFVKEKNRSERVPFIATRIHQLLDVCKIFLCSELCPDILEKWCRNRRKWKFQGVMLYKQTQKFKKLYKMCFSMSGNDHALKKKTNFTSNQDQVVFCSKHDSYLNDKI